MFVQQITHRYVLIKCLQEIDVNNFDIYRKIVSFIHFASTQYVKLCCTKKVWTIQVTAECIYYMAKKRLNRPATSHNKFKRYN